jgi:prepilin-type processing-associated H-X9-DG protein
MNLFLGGFTGTFGGWDNTITELRALRLFLKTTDITPATPAKIFVFMDQRSDNINWSNFMVNMSGSLSSNPALYGFGDVPGFFHDGGAAFSFADGSGELHRWQDLRTTPPLSPNGNIISGPSSSPNNPDVAWLQERATCPQ